MQLWLELSHTERIFRLSIQSANAYNLFICVILNSQNYDILTVIKTIYQNYQ